MSDLRTTHVLTPEQLGRAARALRRAMFSSLSGAVITCQQSAPNRLHVESVYEGRKAWVDLDIPFTPVSLIVAGALLLQQLNTYTG